MTNPIVDLIGDRTGRIVPIYPQSEKAALSTWEIAGWVEDALERCSPRGIADPLPGRRRAPPQPARAATRRSRHPPARDDRRQGARPAGGWRSTSCCASRPCSCCASGRSSARRGASATSSTASLVGGCASACRTRSPARSSGRSTRSRPTSPAPHPMHRLLQGDVGAGKTLVAVSALLAAVQGGHQGALMAPTEVLAEQHAAGVRRLLAGVTVPGPRQPVRRSAAARRAAHQPGHRRSTARTCSPGWPTAPSTSPSAPTRSSRSAVAFHSLGVVVIDEQHRFGVEQRAALRAKGDGDARARRAGDDGHADPAHGGDDRLRRPRRERARRAAARSDADRHAWADGPLMEAGGVGDGARRGGRRPAGVRRVPAHRREREAGGAPAPRRPTTASPPTSCTGCASACSTGGCRRPTRRR